MKKLLGGAGAALGVKILTGFAVAAAATTFAVAATEVAITGSVNPANWGQGQQVTTQVNACKASAARLGVHGIGQCVASFARTHGDTVSDSHAKNDKTKTGVTGNGSPNPNANAKNNNPGQGSSRSQGARPAITTAGEPTDPADLVQVSITPQP